MNRKGFTLVEILASLVILGLLTALAAPNVLGILTNSRNSTYIDDAKKLSTLAEYKFRGDTSIARPGNGEYVVLSMKYLGTSEFKNAPNGGHYDNGKSYVLITNNGGKYEYYVQLVEEKDETYRGIQGVKVSELSEDYKFKYIVNLNADSIQDVSDATSFTISVWNGSDLGKTTVNAKQVYRGY